MQILSLLGGLVIVAMFMAVVVFIEHLIMFGGKNKSGKNKKRK